MKIGLDFDGVISDCGKLKSFAAKELFGLNIPSSKFKFELVVGGGILTSHQYRYLQKAIYDTWELGRLMEPVDGALDYIPKLMNEGHKIVVITSRNETALKIAKSWAKERQLKLEFIGVGPGTSKAQAAKGLEMYIDDDLDKLEPLIDLVPRLYLFSHGYNAHVMTGTISGRLNSWRELNEIIKQDTHSAG